MNILYVCDDKFAMVLGTSLTSLYRYNQDAEDLNVYVIDDGIGKLNRDRLIETAGKYGRAIRFIPKPDMENLLGYRADTLKWSDNVFCRLYISTLFAEYPEVQKILYIDCDTVICGSLKSLWEFDLKGQICAAGLECMGTLHKKLIGLEKEEPYVNAGVMLVDLNRWRENHIEQKCTGFLQHYAGSLEYLDESTLNGVLHGQIAILPPEYNLTTLKCSFTYDELKRYRKSKVMYKKEAYQRALEQPVIVHYTDNFLVRRPWVAGKENAHYYEAQFLENKKQSLWEKEPLFIRKDSTAKRLAKIASKYSRRMVIEVCGVLHSYWKPMKYLWIRNNAKTS